MRAHSPHLLGEAVLFFLYSYAIESGGIFYRAPLLEHFRPQGATSTILDFALEELLNRNHIEKGRSRDGHIGYEISRAGYEYVRYRLNFEDSAISHFAKDSSWLQKPELDGDDAVDEQSSKGNVSDSENGDIWEPLPIERDAQSYQEAVPAVENAFERIKENNGYAETDPEERNHIVSSLEEGLRQLKEGLPSRAQITSLLIHPLKKIATKFADSAMGVAAKAGVEKLIAWLGTFF